MSIACIVECVWTSALLSDSDTIDVCFCACDDSGDIWRIEIHRIRLRANALFSRPYL